MSRRPSTLRSSKLARLFLCILFMFQSGAALAAPPRVRPQPIATTFTPTPTQATLLTPRSKYLAAHAGTICQQSHCGFLPYVTSGGGQLPGMPTEPTPEPSGPQPNPTPGPADPDPTPEPTEPQPDPTSGPVGADPTPKPTDSDAEPPSVPQQLRATETTTTVSLAWQAASDNVGVAGYQLYRDGSRILDTAATNATIAGLTPSTAYTFAVAAYDAAGNHSALSASIVVTTADPAPPAPDPVVPDALRPWNVHVVTRTHGTFDLAWEAPAENPDVVRYDVMAGDTWLGSTEMPELSVAGLAAATSYPVQVYAVDGSGISSDPSDTITVTTSLPPVPQAIAPPTDATTPGEIAGDTAFLYTGADPIQAGVRAGTIDPQRVAVLRGLVTDRDGTPLAGVHISVRNHAEYGSTSTRGDGMFDLAVNGGAPLMLEYAKDGFLTAQRFVEPATRDYTWLPDVALVPFDSAVSTIVLSDTAALQVAAGSPVSDADGARQAMLMFPSGIAATLELADGSEQPLDILHVRATEYTVGPHGPEAMPGALPANSGYTYAVEYSVDEAVALGARQVRFSQPVFAYVENFLHFPVGIPVPAGYYDRERAEWVASESGRIIKIVDIADGRAVIDFDGDVGPDDPTMLGVSDAELEQLAGRYAAGQELWRVPVAHFTPWDFN